jgi:hypothetical protein
MLGKIIGAAIGKKIAGRHGGARGMVIGALVPFVARRAFGPLGLAVGGGYLAKKLYDRSKRRSGGGSGSY